MSSSLAATDEHAAPPVSIGLPVFNGENYIGEAIRSILDQSFTEFELIISDNASGDRTEDICRRYAEADPRVRYFRNPANLGAAANWNRVFELARGEYFKWIAHDDLHEREFLSRCLRALEQEPSAVLAFTRAVTVDPDGQFIRAWAADSRLTAADVAERYRASMEPPKDPLPLPIFALMRSGILRATRLFRWYPEADIALVAELSLHGRFVEVPEHLFVHREHKNRAGPRLARNVQQALMFWDPGNTGRLRFPHWSLMLGHLSGLLKSPGRFTDRARCLLIFTGWSWRNANRLWWDLITAASRIPVLRPGIARLADAIRIWSWRLRLARAKRDLEHLIPLSNTYVLVDAGEFGDGLIAKRRARAFMERDGQYWGPPPDDVTAVRELEHMRNAGASFLVFGWPCFWWLNYYREFVADLDRRFGRILQNDRVIVYDLRRETE